MSTPDRMIIEQHACYDCEWDQDKQCFGRIDILRGLDPRHHTFSPERYSKFKYGSRTACEHFASEVYLALKSLFSEDLEHDTTSLVMTSSAYKSMPAASTALFADVLSLVNKERQSRNLASLEDIKIHRKSVLKTDYALMTQESRVKAMESTQLDIDSSNLRGKHLVVLDDCIITGAHARNITHHMRNSGVAKISYLFIVSVKSKSPYQSMTSAENYLNHHYVSSLDRWLEMMNAPDAGPLSARALKYFLTSDESQEKKYGFLARLRREAVLEMYRGAIADEMASSFEDQMEAIKRQLVANEMNYKETIENSRGNCVESDPGNDADAAGGNIHVARHTEENEDDVRDEVELSPDGGECSRQRGSPLSWAAAATVVTSGRPVASSSPSTSTSSEDSLLPRPPQVSARPTLQRSKSSTIHRSIRGLRANLLRQSSESFRALKRQSLSLTGDMNDGIFKNQIRFHPKAARGERGRKVSDADDGQAFNVPSDIVLKV
jgi:hypothetical protein